MSWGFKPHQPAAPAQTKTALEVLLERFDQLERHVIFRLSKIEAIIATAEAQMAIDVTKLQADVTALDSAVQGSAVVIAALKQTNADQAANIITLQAALAAAQSTSDPAVQAAIDAMDVTVKNDAQIIAGAPAAVQANTTTPPADQTAAAATVAAATTTPASS